MYNKTFSYHALIYILWYIKHLKTGGEYFKEYGALMKAWNNDWRPDRWVKQIHKHKLPYLRAYAPARVENYEGKLIQQSGRGREIYLVVGKQKRAFPDMATFTAMNYRLEDVHIVSNEIIKLIPLGLPFEQHRSPAVIASKI